MKTKYKSAILTSVSYLVGILVQLTVFPMFGIQVNILDSFTLGFIFMAASFCTTYVCLRIIEHKERKLNKRKDTNETT